MGNTPNIRFKGFTDDWEQRKFANITMRESTVGVSSSTYPSVEYEDVIAGEGRLNKDIKYKEQQKTGIVFNGTQILYGKLRPYLHNWLNPDFSGIAVGDWWVLKPVETDKSFIYRLIQTQQFDDVANQSAGSKMPRADWNLVSNTEFRIPKTSEEQMAIGTYFSNLDHLITLHQRKCDETKKLKKFMLQKMFPKKDAKKPEIRFAGFTNDWEQRKLGDWGDFYYGRSCPKWSVTEDATIPCIRYGELYTKFGAKIDRVYSYTNMPPENLRFSKGTEVLIPRVGENPMDYNHCTWLSMKDVAIGEMISVFNTDNNPLFTATMFNATLQNEFAMRVEGGSVTNLYFEKLKNIDVSFPSIREQEMIAAYFENIDNLITLHQRKCDELKEFKKYMLQNMFPQKG